MKSITLTQLSYVVAVYKARNFGQAAKACNVTQPTLSMQIQKLEEVLDVVIFDRSKKPVEPTSAGKKIIDQALLVLRGVERIDDLVQEEKNEISGDFSLGIIPTLAPYLLPLFLENFIEKFPRVNLVIEELQTNQIINKLNADELDAGLLVTPLKNKAIIEKPLFYEPFAVYIHPSHGLASLGRVSEKDLSLKDVWLLNEGHCFRDQSIALCKKRGSLREGGRSVAFESGNLETLKRLVDRKIGYTLVPFLSVREMPERQRKKRLRMFRVPVPTREVSLVYCRSFLKQRIIEELFMIIQQSIPPELKKSGVKPKVVALGAV